MPNPKIAFRIWPDAQAKLFDEVKHYKGTTSHRSVCQQTVLDVPAKVVGGSEA
jgi:hypothetical protein